MQQLEFLQRRAESIEKSYLGGRVHHPVGTRHEHQDGNPDGRRVLDEPRGRVMQVDEDPGIAANSRSSAQVVGLNNGVTGLTTSVKLAPAVCYTSGFPRRSK